MMSFISSTVGRYEDLKRFSAGIYQSNSPFYKGIPKTKRRRKGKR